MPQLLCVSVFLIVSGLEAAEIHAVWDHSGRGLYPGDWTKTMAVLKKGNVTDLYLNVGGVDFAHYASVRLLPGVLGGGAAATASESFGRDGLLEAPQYTHPPEFRGMKVPEVLLSGDHAKIEAWKRSEARKLTERERPDLIDAEVR